MGKYVDNVLEEAFLEPSLEKGTIYLSIIITFIGAYLALTDFSYLYYLAIISFSSSLLLNQLNKFIKENEIRFREIVYGLFTLIFLTLPSFLPEKIGVPIGDIKFGLSNAFLSSILLVLVGLFGIYVSLGALYNKEKKTQESSAYLYISLSILTVLSILFLIISYIVINGIGAINLEFLTQDIQNMGASGGVFPAIIGTLLLGIGTALISVPLGVGTAIFLKEYSKDNSPLVRFIRTSVNVLNATPSIVHGLFGLALFVPVFGISLLTGSLILGFLTLPIIIRSTEEALESVSKDIRDASFAMGATRWQTIKNAVLPPALPGIVTGAVLGLGRAFGETAPIMFTAVTFSGAGVPTSLFDSVNALSYHLLELTRLIGYKEVTQNAWGTALLLLVIVLSMNFLGIRIRKKYSS